MKPRGVGLLEHGIKRTTWKTVAAHWNPPSKYATRTNDSGGISAPSSGTRKPRTPRNEEESPPSPFYKQSAHARTRTRTYIQIHACTYTTDTRAYAHRHTYTHAHSGARKARTLSVGHTYILDGMRGAMALDESKRIAVCSANHSRPVSSSNRRRIKTASE